jgi:resuscitation-promoting factor RpfA
MPRQPAPDSARHGTSGGGDASPKPDHRAQSTADSSRSHPRARAATTDAQAAPTYRVEPGDSLWRIASRHLGADATDLETAQEVNRLWKLNEQRIATGSPDLIFPGQTLRM